MLITPIGDKWLENGQLMMLKYNYDKKLGSDGKYGKFFCLGSCDGGPVRHASQAEKVARFLGSAIFSP